MRCLFSKGSVSECQHHPLNTSWHVWEIASPTGSWLLCTSGMDHQKWAQCRHQNLSGLKSKNEAPRKETRGGRWESNRSRQQDAVSSCLYDIRAYSELLVGQNSTRSMSWRHQDQELWSTCGILELWALLSLYSRLDPRESTAILIAHVFSGQLYPVVADWPFQKGGGFKAKEIRC